MPTNELFWMSTAAPRYAPDFVLATSANKLQGYAVNGNTITTYGDLSAEITEIGAFTRVGITGLDNSTIGLVASDGSNNFLMGMYRYSTSTETFAAVGNLIESDTTTYCAFPTCAGLSASRMVIGGTGGVSMQIYEHDGSDWTSDGNSNSNAASSLCGISETEVARWLSTTNRIAKYTYSDPNWAQDFTSANLGTQVAQVCALGDDDIAIFLAGDDDLEHWNLDGSASQTGNSLSIPGEGFTGLCPITSTKIVFASEANQTLQVYTWDGTDWTAQGTPLAADVAEAAGGGVASLIFRPF